MNPPKMILFDFGETLLQEGNFDPLRGTRALMQYVVVNEQQLTPEEIQAFADCVNKEIGRSDPFTKDGQKAEICNFAFQQFLYEYLGISFSISQKEIEEIFWKYAAIDTTPTCHIVELLDFLFEMGIRTGVISNISFSGRSLQKRIEQYLPDHHFEFVLASSEYVFRKPCHLIFELAARKAKLNTAEIWYCGDNPICDAVGAAKAGMIPVLYDPFDRKETSVPAIHITDWVELIDLLKTFRKAVI